MVNGRRRALGMVLVGALAALVLPLAGTGWAAPPKRVTITFTSGPTAATGGATNQTTAGFVFTSNPTTATLTCSLDGARATACTSPVNLTGLRTGTHTFTVRGSASGYKGGSASWTWTVDLTAPPAPSVSKPSSPNNLSTVPLTLSDSATDLRTPNPYTCSLDAAGPVNCSSPYNAVVSTDGPHSVTVRAVDKAGNISKATTVSWLRDTVVHAPVVNSGPASLTTATSAAFTFGSDETGVTFACKLDAGAYAACNSGTASYSGLSSSNGGTNHSFTVKVTDAAGNVATSSAYTWTIKNAVPISLGWTDTSTLPKAVTNQTGGSFAFSTTGSPTVTCSLDGAAAAPCTSPYLASSLLEGSHSLVVSAAGGFPAATVNLTYTWSVDLTPPSAPIIDGPTGTVASTDATVAVVPGEAGGTVTCTVDGTPTSCTASVVLTGLAQGPHQVDALATDAAGNTASSSLSWTVDTVGPVATVTVPATLASPATVTFDEAASGVDATSVALLTALGAPVTSTMVCKDGAAAVVDCAGTGVRSVRLTPTSSLVSGEHYQVVVNPASALLVTDTVGNQATSVTQAFRGALVQQETSVGATYAWQTVRTSKAKGGSYLQERSAGASVSYSFSGRSITWVTVKGPKFGWADVYVDGKRKASYNSYAARTGYGVVHTVKGLSSGSHTVKVVAKGKKGSKKAKDTLVAVDGFKVGKKLTATPKVKAGWRHISATSADGKGYAVATLKGESVSFRFRGTAVTWRTVTGPASGKVAVYVDGVKKALVDNWSKATVYHVDRLVSGLTDATHTLKLVATGTKNQRSKGTAVAIDAWTVS